MGSASPQFKRCASLLVSKERRGIAGNTAFIGVDTGYLIAPSLAGMIVTYVHSQGGTELAGYAVMFRVMTIPILLALILFLWKRKSILLRVKNMK